MRRSAYGAALAAGLLAIAGCAGVRQAFSPGPAGEPSGREGWLIYTVGDLRFEAPAGWQASGDGGHVSLGAPDGRARLEVTRVETSFGSEGECLARADEALRRGEAQLQRVRRHPTKVAGLRGVTQEADQGGWHGWAYAVCEGPVQYRMFFTTLSPATPDAQEAYRTLVQTVRIGGEA
jgi:hypothetical protein